MVSYGDPMAYTSTGYIWFAIPAELGWSKPLILQLDGSLGLHCALILFGLFDMLGQRPLISISNISWSCCWMNKYVYTYIYTLHLGRKLQLAVEIFIDDCPLPLLTFLLLLAGHLALGCWLFIQSSW